MKPSPKLWLPLAILLLGGLGVALMLTTRPQVEARPPEISAPLVRVVAVTPRDVRFVVHAQGTVVPRTESDLVPQVSGVVTWVSPSLASGGFFEAGDALVRIERADYEAAYESARAAVARARSEHARARKERERQRLLAESSVASQARIDDAENAFSVSAAELRDTRASRERAERDLARTEMSAPYAGRVRSESIDVGQFVNRGAPIAKLYAVDFAEVRLPIPDRELAYLDLPLTYRRTPGEADGGPPSGPEVSLRAEFAGRKHVWSGRIVRTEGEIDPKSRMVNAVARVEDPYGADAVGGRPPLAVGLFVEAEIHGNRVEGVFALPRTALRDGGRVLVVDDQDRLRFRKVEVLRVERERVVIGAGLVPGERVCISPLVGVVDGMLVRVLEAKAARSDVARSEP